MLIFVNVHTHTHTHTHARTHTCIEMDGSHYNLLTMNHGQTKILQNESWPWIIVSQEDIIQKKKNTTEICSEIFFFICMKWKTNTHCTIPCFISNVWNIMLDSDSWSRKQSWPWIMVRQSFLTLNHCQSWTIHKMYTICMLSRIEI